jgi:hypothetical protein
VILLSRRKPSPASSQIRSPLALHHDVHQLHAEGTDYLLFLLVLLLRTPPLVMRWRRGAPAGLNPSWERVAGILAFNLRIETMQVLVVAIILPSQVLTSRTRAYPIVRIGGAACAGRASVGWLAEQLFDLATPVDSIVTVLGRSKACRKARALRLR